MDIERTMQFIVEQLAALTAREEKWREEAEERQKRIEERQDQLTEWQLQAEERHDKEMGEIRAELRRAIRFSVEEHKRERVRRHELEADMKAGMDELRKSLQRFLDRSGNGHQPAS